MHREYIDKIIMSGNDNQMRELKDVLVDTISYIKNNDEDTYNKIECDLYEIAEGKVITEEKAIEWVNNMKPKAKWSLDDIEKISKQIEVDLPIIPAYIIMNMLYSHYSDIIGEPNTDEIIDKYVKAAENWYYDEDATKTEDEKLFYYWKIFIQN